MDIILSKFAVASISIGLLFNFLLGGSAEVQPPAIQNEPQFIKTEKEISHQQKVWIFALEFCESKGKGIEAINPKDLDNTPSYYHFQWKPSTFKSYAIKYKLLRNDLEYEDYFNWMSDYDLQYKIVSRMVNDKNITPHIWRNVLFPGCIKRLGLPPIN